MPPISLELTTHEIDAIYVEAEQHCPPIMSSDRVETLYTQPPALGRGHTREIQLCAGLELRIVDVVQHGVIERVPENEHPVQFCAYLSGLIESGDYASGGALRIDTNYGYVGGSGIQPSHFVRPQISQRQVGVDIHMTPALFHQFFANGHGELPASLQPLVRGDDWQQRFSPPMTDAMRGVIKQLIHCPFQGMTKRAYLQAKVFELMALQLDGLVASPRSLPTQSLKADTRDRIHHAAAILRSQLESPPCQTTLAQQVGMSDRTLQKGFKAEFGVTPFAYLTQQRMHQAEQLLRQPGQTVAEIANIVGYANPAQFAAAFKRQFGMTPRKCLQQNR
ncbi:MAG: AraC family transcriptional regulator [Cyanobacteria bacterium P01_D01_bin.115]